MVLVITGVASKEVLERWTFDIQTDKAVVAGRWVLHVPVSIFPGWVVRHQQPTGTRKAHGLMSSWRAGWQVAGTCTSELRIPPCSPCPPTLLPTARRCRRSRRRRSRRRSRPSSGKSPLPSPSCRCCPTSVSMRALGPCLLRGMGLQLRSLSRADPRLTQSSLVSANCMPCCTASDPPFPVTLGAGTIDLLAYTDKENEVPLDWEESDPRYITNAADVKLRAFSTKVGAGTVTLLGDDCVVAINTQQSSTAPIEGKLCGPPLLCAMTQLQL